MIRCRLLGAAELLSSDRRELRTVLAQPKRLALLAYLAVAMPGRFHRRDSLLPLFWPELDQDHARNALRQAIHHLRQALGVDVIRSRGTEEIGLDAERFWCDVAAFEQAIEANELPRGLELYGGDLLPGFFVSGAPEFEQWLELERARLRGRAATAARRLADLEDSNGNPSAAVHWSRLSIRHSPDDEGGLRRLMELLAKAGDRVGAARVFEEFAERLATDFDLEPSSETRALLTRVTDPLPSSYAPPPRAGAPLLEPVMVARPAEVQASAARRRWRSRTTFVALLGAFGVLATTAAALLWGPGTSAPAPGELQVAVAVLPFPIRGRPDLAYLREGLVDLLSVKLDGTTSLRSVDPRAIISTVGPEDPNAPLDGASSARVAQRLGAQWYVVGDVVEIAGRLQISAALYDVANRSRPAAQAAVEGETQKLFELVDELAGRLLAGRLTGRDSILTHLAGMTTRSLPALKAFLDGEREFRAGRETRAVNRFMEAIALDTSFALAYYRLASASRWAPLPFDSSRKLAAQAVKRSDRLPRLARELLRGFLAYMALDSASGPIFRAVRTEHPDNVEAWFMEGEALFHYNPFRGKPFTEARAAFERVVFLDPGNPHAMLHLARIAAFERKLPELDSLVGRFLAAYPDAERIAEMRALRAFAHDDTIEQQTLGVEMRSAREVVLDAVVVAAVALNEDPVAIDAMLPAYDVEGRTTLLLSRGATMFGQIPLARGIRRSAGTMLGRLAEMEPDWPIEARALFAANAIVPVAAAELTALRDSIARGTPHAVPAGSVFAYHTTLHPQMRSYLLGLLSVRLGEPARAAQYAAELERLSDTPSDSGFGRAFAYVVRAEIARAAGDTETALQLVSRYPFNRAPPLDMQIFFASAHPRFLRAELLYALGRDQEALQWFGSFPEPSARDLMYLAPAHLRRGEIYERLGNRPSAIAYYSRFIQLWKDCDPELRPLVARAELAVARLKRTQ